MTKKIKGSLDEIVEAVSKVCAQCLVHSHRQVSDDSIRTALAKFVVEEGWISVEDRLPESGENILMYHLQYNIGIGYCMPLDGSFAGTFHGVPVIDKSKKVTHWMPLPTTPTEKGFNPEQQLGIINTASQMFGGNKKGGDDEA